MSTKRLCNASYFREILAALALLAFPAALPAAELQILLPLGRTAYQTNEWIDVSVRPCRPPRPCRPAPSL